MIFIYNFILLFLSPLMILCWGISLMQRKFSTGWKERLGFLPSGLIHPIENQTVLWIHAVSVGEVLAAGPLIRLLKEKHPEKKLVLSTVTVTGQRTARTKIKGLDGLFYFPFDIPWIVKRVVRLIHPAVFIFFETEIWPNLLETLYRENIPAVLVNGRLSGKSFSRYLKIKWFMKSWVRNISFCLMQTDSDKQRIIELGADPRRVINTGNTKYDQLKRPAVTPFQDLWILKEWDWWVAGSTHPGEEDLILEAFLSLSRQNPRLGLILAPRHPERIGEVSGLMNKKGIVFFQRSHLKKEPCRDCGHPPVILLDTIGELSDFYYWAAIAFIGGSLVRRGGHNILEAVVWGKAPFFGPHTENFSEMIQRFKEKQACVEVSGKEDLIEKTSYYLRNRGQLEQMGRAALKILYDNQGASRKNLEVIERFIP